MKKKKSKNSILTMLGHTNIKIFEQYYNQSNQIEMNIEQAKLIPVEQILYRMGLKTQKISGTDLWFKRVFSINEKTASFKVNQNINRWYCHSSGFGGNSLDLVLKTSNCTVSEALIYLKNFKTLLSFQQQEKTIYKPIEKEYKILLVKSIENSTLINYLHSRKIFVWNKICEIHYRVKNKNYYSIAFPNDDLGFEIRNRFMKGCLLKKSITMIKNGSGTLTIFEGFFCYLTYLNTENTLSDFLILNSVSNLKKCLNRLSDYQNIQLFLDNDLSGNNATEEILKSYPNAIDFRKKYYPFKDYNEWHIATKLEVI